MKASSPQRRVAVAACVKLTGTPRAVAKMEVFRTRAALHLKDLNPVLWTPDLSGESRS